MEHVGRAGLLDCRLERCVIAQIAVQKLEPLTLVRERQQVRDVVERAAPAAQAEKVPVGALQQEIRQVRTDHPADAGDNSAGPAHLLLRDARLRMRAAIGPVLLSAGRIYPKVDADHSTAPWL